MEISGTFGRNLEDSDKITFDVVRQGNLQNWIRKQK
jgi:hypothetical protein